MSSSAADQTHRTWTGSRGAIVALVLLRVGIGWHLLYEGLVKLADPGWTSAGYLLRSSWLLSDWFHAVAADAQWLRIVDLLNMWGLTLVGLGLLVGAFSRLASLAGALLLALYYLAAPPFLPAGAHLEGSYLFIDKNAVEFLALLVLTMAPTGRVAGIDGLLTRWWRGRTAPAPAVTETVSAPAGNPHHSSRRELLQHLAIVPVLGSFIYAFHRKRGWRSFEVEHLLDWQRTADATSSATVKTFKFAQMDELKGQVPHARIGDLDLSRMFLGGNLIGGWAHARDLIYADSLVKAYHTDAKVFETFHMAEQAGMNTILTNPRLCRVIADYWNIEGGKIQFISDCAEGTILEGAKKSIDAGACACYVQGGVADKMVDEGDFDSIAQALDLIRQNGLPAGIGGHRLETIQGCVDKGLKPDFWVKTLHPIDYWSAKTEPSHDNIWCLNPDETVAYMERIEEPWIAFKILAAGAVHPERGFAYALENGADFLCVGMYDFQLVDNVNLFLDVLGGLGERRRPWRA